MSWKRKAHEPRNYATFLRDDEDVRKMFLRLDDVTFKRLQLYERKMGKLTTKQLLGTVEDFTNRNSNDLLKTNCCLYDLSEDCKSFNNRINTREASINPSAYLRQKWDLKLYKRDVAAGEKRKQDLQAARYSHNDKMVALIFKEITGRNF